MKNPIVIASIVLSVSAIIISLMNVYPVYACAYSQDEPANPGVWMRCIHGTN